MSSIIYGMRDDEQAGSTGFGDGHAALWRGTPESRIDLHPAGYISSVAYATDGEYQGGLVQLPGTVHAGLWHGTAASFVDLNPPASGLSEIFGMAPGQQVGFYAGAAGTHAAMWSGTVESFIDMHPGGGGTSWLYATTGAIQAGYAGGAFTGGAAHAGLWFGTPNSFLDLHAYLPAGYSVSAASSLYQEGDTLYVGGYALRNGSYEAVMWVGTVPAPGATGALVIGSALALRRRRRAAN